MLSVPIVEIVGDALEAVLEGRHPEIHEQTERQVHHPQIGQHLFAVDRRIALDRLQFDQQSLLDQQIDFEAVVYDNAFVADRHDNLPTHRQAALAEFLRQENFIDGFEQARSDLLVQVKAAIHSNPGKAIDLDQALPLGVFASWREKGSQTGSAAVPVTVQV